MLSLNFIRTKGLHNSIVDLDPISEAIFTFNWESDVGWGFWRSRCSCGGYDGGFRWNECG